MRILYIDIDSLRPDHLGCYGYHRNTSPNIDRIASQSVRFTNYYTSDAPCLPSRTAMWSGRFGIHTGVASNGGAAADPFPEGANRGAIRTIHYACDPDARRLLFETTFSQTGWLSCLRQTGIERTPTISSFPERHSCWYWQSYFTETQNPGGRGNETAEQVTPFALDWINRHGAEDNWFLHVNFWDPHLPYRTPTSYGDPFAGEPLPAWLTEEVRRQHWQGFGPHSAQDYGGFGPFPRKMPRHPKLIDSMQSVRMMFDGYDTAIRYVDDHVGQILDALADQGVLDETLIIITADHGECLGELNIYSDHCTADHYTCRVPLIVRWPGQETGRVDDALHYHVDFAATLVELLGGTVPAIWDGVSFADAFQSGTQRGRDHLVLSYGGWSCQRAVRWQNYLCILTFHSGYHDFPRVVLFDLDADPHEQHDLAATHPQIVGQAADHYWRWYTEMMRTAHHPEDPMWKMVLDGGAWYTRGRLPEFLEWLRETGRHDAVDRLTATHPKELA